MEKYKRYYGILFFIAIVALALFIACKLVYPKFAEFNRLDGDFKEQSQKLEDVKNNVKIVQGKIKRLKDSVLGSQKKIYSPVESDLRDDDSLFFTLYNDTIEMIHGNSVKIKSIEYKYNPEGDPFVENGKERYFVCEIDLELVSNYTNLGKLIQDLYQYPYFIKINNISIHPLQRDKKILITNMSLVLYANTSPVDETAEESVKEIIPTD